MIRRGMLSVMLVLATMATAGAQVQRKDAFKEGNWSGFASYDASNAFTHCVVSAPPANGWTMLLTMRDAAAVRLAFGNDKLALKAGNTIEMKLGIDLKPEITQRFSVINPKLMFVSTEPAAGWFKDLRAARTLKIGLGAASQVFTVAGLDAAVTRLGECVAKNKRPG